jgi:hypothetical protein
MQILGNKFAFYGFAGRGAQNTLSEQAASISKRTTSSAFLPSALIVPAQVVPKIVCCT